jgi:uncharacterized protein
VTVVGAILALLLLFAGAASAQPACPPEPVVPTPAQIQDAAQKARNRGALWRFEKDGRHGYLYGSVHVGKLEWAIPGTVVARALREAETIAVEVRVLDPAFQETMGAAQKPGERPALPPALLARLRKQAEKVCAPWEKLEAMPPMMILTTLAVLEARWDGLYADYAVEIVLEGIGKAAGKDIVALETAAIQRTALMGGAPADQLREIEIATAQMEDGTTRKELAATANAWATGDLDALMRPFAGLKPAERVMVERLVFGRNAGLAARIDELHQRGRRLFATAGIMHMIGDQGLPKLLAARGYKVERLAFDDR